MQLEIDDPLHEIPSEIQLAVVAPGTQKRRKPIIVFSERHCRIHPGNESVRHLATVSAKQFCFDVLVRFFNNPFVLQDALNAPDRFTIRSQPVGRTRLDCLYGYAIVLTEEP